MTLPSFVDKLAHFAVGLAIGASFWGLLERHAFIGVRRINPILFALMLIWGASGLFFFRRLHIPILSDQFFYMAVPDWDIPLYNWTRLRFLIHRSATFHSALIPIVLLIASLWGMRRAKLNSNSLRWWRWLRDGGIGLSVGMSAHLIWDALLSSTKSGFVIYGWTHSASQTWLALNLLVGLGVPFVMVRAMGGSGAGNSLNE
ncbi:hypothetical protein [Kamptonema formosum]|uniref:hypothetical protein n=1 Tax=Kamptonema formosum TaxID=331992 RepID=UPI00034CB0CC|nr:hypothetical protein [Oscillatoria sp. PCC 10802]